MRYERTEPSNGVERPGLSGCDLGAAASSCDGAASHLSGAIVAEISLLCAATGVGIRQAHGRAFSLTDFLAAAVADENGLSGQLWSSFTREIADELTEIRTVILRGRACLTNPPGTKQRKQCPLLEIEPDVACADHTQFLGSKVLDRSTVEILLHNGRTDI